MLISYNTDIGNLNRNVGYGEAGNQMVLALQELGHEVLFSDDIPNLEIWFCQPEYWQFSREDQYKIGYVPWESTQFPESWPWHMTQADEIWTPTPWCKMIFEEFNGLKDVKVYPHGVDHAWKPYKRTPKDKLRFLHVGEPAGRKAGQLVVDTFMELFGGNNDVELILKAHNINTTRIYDRMGSIVNTVDRVPNIKLITDDYPFEQMVSLYWSAHCLLYPSWGEGFGFIPLQALATGMPTICTGAWAPYKGYLNDLAIKSQLVESPWPGMHPGLMEEPDKADLAEKMLAVYNDYSKYSDQFFNQAQDVHEEYDWVTLTKEAFDPLIKKLG